MKHLISAGTKFFAAILTIFFVILGLLMFVFGLMSEILVKTYFGVHVDKSYSIKEVVENR